ncbi:MAG TPA: chromate efflux transporter [Anaerolineales bacterium]|nr:chromate efflux transporter [Anaerolineales bacterium]
MTAPADGRRNLAEVLQVFLRLGVAGFGGPAAHIAMMRDDVVRRRGWLDDDAFLDLLGATNLIPGPNSTEMAIHLGYLRAGWRGLIVGGVSFILPAVLIVSALAWAYVRYGSLPAAGWLLYGIKPVVLAIIVHALWALGRRAVRGPLLAAVGLAVLMLSVFGVNEIVLLFGGGLIVLLAGQGSQSSPPGPSLAASVALGLPAGLAALPAAPSLLLLFLTCLKIGSVLYGSGYVLLAFLRADFVTRLGWLTDQQLLDAIAVGQVTPGPLFTSATFIGYLVGRIPGALLATLGIFLPSFVFVLLSRPLLPRLRSSPALSALLDGVNVASLGLIAAVAIQVARASIVDLPTAALGLLAAVALARTRLNPTWWIAAGGAAGIALQWLRGFVG